MRRFTSQISGITYTLYAPIEMDIGAIGPVARLNLCNRMYLPQLTGSGYVYFACYGLDAGSYIFFSLREF